MVTREEATWVENQSEREWWESGGVFWKFVKRNSHGLLPGKWKLAMSAQMGIH